MGEASLLYVEKSDEMKLRLGDLVSSSYPGMGLHVVLSPFSTGARAMLMRAEGKGVYPVSSACTTQLESPVKDIVHGLWGCLVARGSDEIRHFRKETSRRMKSLKS